jgi:hypothetical protein
MLVPHTKRLFFASSEIAADDYQAETFSILRFERLLILAGVKTFFISFVCLLDAKPN